MCMPTVLAFLSKPEREVVKPGTMEMEMEMEWEWNHHSHSAIVARGASILEVAIPFEFCYHSL